jgi:hypothetical protein
MAGLTRRSEDRTMLKGSTDRSGKDRVAAGTPALNSSFLVTLSMTCALWMTAAFTSNMALATSSFAQENARLNVQHFSDPNPADSPLIAIWSDRIEDHNAFMAKIGGPGAPKPGRNAAIYISSAQISSGELSISISMWLSPTTCEGVGNGPALGDVEPQLCQARVAVTENGKTRVIKTEFCNLLYEYDNKNFNDRKNYVEFSYNARTSVLSSRAFLNGRSVSGCTKSMNTESAR